MDRRARRSPARFLAPLALIAVLVVLLAIINGSGPGGGSTSAGTTTPAAGTTTTSKKSRTKTKTKSGSHTVVRKSTYTVQVGDTLGGIATKTGVPLSRIQELNPNVDPHAMVAGQQIRLR